MAVEDYEEDEFQKGAVVEVSSEDSGLRGSWFTATVIRPVSRKTFKILVEYHTLMSDRQGKKPLREFVKCVLIRPVPPRESRRRFQLSEEVDAYLDDGWWEGVVTEILPNSRYAVFFRCSREQLEFSESELRLHREWVYGNWKPPLETEIQDKPTSTSTSASASSSSTVQINGVSRSQSQPCDSLSVRLRDLGRRKRGRKGREQMRNGSGEFVSSKK